MTAPPTHNGQDGKQPDIESPAQASLGLVVDHASDLIDDPRSRRIVLQLIGLIDGPQRRRLGRIILG